MTCENESLNTLRYANRAQNIENVPLMKSDSRENIILKLKRELRKLKEENQTLKQQLGASSVPHQLFITSGTGSTGSGSGSRLPKINTARNGSSNSNASNDSELYGKLHEYMLQNKTLKNENSQLEKFREKVRKQHEVLTRENEKLARKLESVLRTQGHPIDLIQNSTEYIAVDEAPILVSPSKSRALPKIEKQDVVWMNKKNFLIQLDLRVIQFLLDRFK